MFAANLPRKERSGPPDRTATRSHGERRRKGRERGHFGRFAEGVLRRRLLLGCKLDVLRVSRTATRFSGLHTAAAVRAAGDEGAQQVHQATGRRQGHGRRAEELQGHREAQAGTTTADLWPASSRPVVEYTQDIDDWLAVIGTGRSVGITPESTVNQYRRDGIVFRRPRDASPVAVRLIWRHHDTHPATHAAVALLTDLYRQRT